MTIPVFYTPKMVASDRNSPSVAKPKAVVESWLAAGLPIEIVEPRPLTPAEIATAHDPKMVRAVLACREDNGFGTRSRAVAAALPYTSGAMYAAARHALETGTVACAPVSGAHHAGYDSPSGFCTFNFLVITARMLRQSHPGLKVGILDCDVHYGNGTDAICDRLRLREWIIHRTSGAARNQSPRNRYADFFAWLEEALHAMQGCDVILYQAGGDMAAGDPLGGFLPADLMQKRDRTVFEFCSEHKIPVAFDLAGGYAVDSAGTIFPVVRTHCVTMQECCRVYADWSPADGAEDQKSQGTTARTSQNRR